MLQAYILPLVVLYVVTGAIHPDSVSGDCRSGRPSNDTLVNDDQAMLQTKHIMSADNDRSTLRFVSENHDMECLYNHLPKAGGTFLKYVLTQTVPAANLRIEQEGDSLTKTDRRHSFTIGSVRNPCDYYVSLWAFGSGGNGPFRHAIPKEYYGGSHGLNTTDDVRRFSDFLGYIMPRGQVGLESARFVLSYFHDGVEEAIKDKIKAPGKLRNMTVIERQAIRRAVDTFDASSVDCWIKTESLVSDLKKCLRAYEKSVGSGSILNWSKLDEALKSEEKENKSKHQPCAFYYDADSAAFVLNADKAIFDKFGYDACCGAPTFAERPPSRSHWMQ